MAAVACSAPIGRSGAARTSSPLAGTTSELVIRSPLAAPGRGYAPLRRGRSVDGDAPALARFGMAARLDRLDDVGVGVPE